VTTKYVHIERTHRLGTTTDILRVDIVTIISLIHVITQAQPSALPWLGLVLPSVKVSSLVPRPNCPYDTSAPVPICPALVPKCLTVPKCLGPKVSWVQVSWHHGDDLAWIRVQTDLDGIRMAPGGVRMASGRVLVGP